MNYLCCATIPDAPQHPTRHDTPHAMTQNTQSFDQNVDAFSPYKLGPLELPNRIVMAPMTRNLAGAGEVPGPISATYYAQRASAGLIVTEGTQISQEGQGYPGTPGIFSPEQIAGWKRVTDAVHAAGGRILAQLWHVGRISHPSLQPGGAAPVAPSALQPPGQTMTAQGMQPFVMPRALETHEIARVVDDSAAPLRVPSAPVSTASNCTAPTAIWSTNSCATRPISARIVMAEAPLIARAF